jgi:sugar transferase (PEP-CTERM/EpsH1 system associated)
MKILWVKAGGLVPPDTGGKIRSFSILRELARQQHSITLFSFYGSLAQDPHPDLAKIFDTVICEPLQVPEAKSIAEMFEYGRHLLSSDPYNITKYCQPRVRRRLRALLKQQSYQVMVCDFLVAAGVVPWDWIPKVLFTHNVEATIWRRHYEVASNPIWKAISRWEWRKMEAAERRYLRLADRVLTVSENDRDAFARFLAPEKISIIPTGVDVDYFQPAALEQTQKSLVFTGSMDWLPNEDGIIYFLDAILPFIKEQCPEVSLTVVGRKPSRKLEALVDGRKDIRLAGWVDDIRPFLARGEVCIVPLRIGGGTRLKIFEAMAMGKPVVSTSVGAEGLPVQSGENIILADEPADFAKAVLSLLRNPAERARIGNAARKLVESNYSWRSVSEQFSRALQEVADHSVAG